MKTSTNSHMHIPTYQLFYIVSPDIVDILSMFLFKANSPNLITSYILKDGTLVISPLLPHLISFFLIY